MSRGEPVRLRDKRSIERYLRGDPFLHIYGLGNLDDFFWPDTAWHALKKAGVLTAVALPYTGLSLPTILASSRETPAMSALLRAILPDLPARFYAHFSPYLYTQVWR